MSTTAYRPDAAGLTSRTRALIDGDRVVAARPLLEALRRLAPEPSEFAELEARLLVREGREPEALATLDGALARDSGNVRLLLDRSELRLQRGDLHLGADDAAAAVIAAPGDSVAKAVLGVALIRLERHEEAAICLAEAVRGDPRHPGFRQALAEAQEAGGDAAGAAETLVEAIARWPQHLPLRIAAIMAAMRAQDFARAVDLAEAARRAGAADACVFGLLGHALSILGRHADASEAYVEALKLAPEDVYVRHLVRASGLLPQSTRAPAAYVEAVFDGYADRFESHLIDLGYRVPGLIRNALRAHWPDSVPIGSVLDLGCGTGLVAVALSDFAIGRLTGVDLSSAMLAEARAKGLYHDLVHADLADMLTDSSERWDIILAADVLNYFGDLDAVLAGVASRLRSGGRFVASFELLSCGDDAPCENWRLHTQGRFAHAAAYVAGAACAAGLQVVSFAEESLRCETGVAVNGLLAVFGRGAH